jgi:hypothetical protein
MVTDPSGAALAGANVTVRNLDTGLTISTVTTDAGLYSVPNLPPGRYSLSVEAPSLKKYTQEGVTVQTGATVALDVQMLLGTVSENVTVNADASQLETATSDIGSTVQRSLVSNLPLAVLGTVRNPVEFIKLVPGFVGSVGNDPADNTKDDFKVNGGQEGGTDVLVDGVSISLVSPNIQWNKGVSSEAVQEFKVLQSNFSPEYGESGDGIVSLTLKSGTNEFHVSAYDYLRNRVLDANSWRNNTSHTPKPIDTQNDFGFTGGGPVRLPHIYNGHDKTFFFLAYEGFRLQTGGTQVLSLPPESFRKGDFSALLPGTQLYDPTTHNAIPGNMLTNDPNFKPSAVMTKVFALLPPTNGGLSNNAIGTSVSKTTANLWDLKIDHVISDKQRISGGFDYGNTFKGNVSSLGPIFGQGTPQSTRYVRFGHNYVFRPTMVNQFLVGFSRRFRGEVANSLGQGYPAKIGLTGVNNTTFPCIKFFGGPYREVLNACGDSQFADNVYQGNDSVSWIKGKHNLKFGGGVRFLQFNVRRLTQSSGEFHFDPAQTSNPTNGTGGDAVASSLFGLVNESILNYGGFSGVRYKDYSFYAQDSYKLRPRLTLNYGLRYDIDLPATEAFDRFSAVDPTLPNPGAGNILGAYTYFGTGTGRNGRKRPQDTYKKAFGPRVGFAYKINEKTVLRGGYGIFYEPLREGSFADQDGLGFFNKQDQTSANGFQIDNGVTHIFPQFGPFTPEGQNNNGGVILVPRSSGRPADIQTWNLDVQRQITSNLVVSVAYVGSKGTHLPALDIIPNQTNPSLLSFFSTFSGDLTKNASCLTNGGCPNAVAAGVKLPYSGFAGNIGQIFRPFPQYGDFNQEDNSFSPDRTGNSTYHAMQLQVDKRFAQGLSLLVSYTVSKNLTDADSAGPGVSGFTGTNSWIGQNSYDRGAEKAVSQLDTPQSLVVSFFYELPVGHGKRYLHEGGFVDRVAGGWYVSGVGSYKSGLPTTVYGSCGGTAGDVLFAGCHFTGIARVNVVPGARETNKSSSFDPSTTSFYNAAAFSTVAPLTFGNEPRSLDHARTWGERDESLALGKKTRIFGERATIDFKAEFFHAFNRHIFKAPGGFDSGLNSPFLPVGAKDSTGKVICSGPFACGFGTVSNTSDPRAIQFGLKIEY